MSKVSCFLVLTLLGGLGHARQPDYPYVDNETIGMFRILSDAVEGAPDTFDERYWGLGLLERVAGGDAMSPLRYLLAFSAYAVVQVADRTPAWRVPYQHAFEGYVDRMLQPEAWQDWLTDWGGLTPLGPDNIMYTGHLALMFALHRQVFGEVRYESPVEFGLTDGSATFQTDLHSLTESLAEQAEETVDNRGDPTLNIACEPGRIFVPCNTPHRISQLIYDGMFGTDYSASNADWSDWVRAHMLEPDSGVMYDLYYPYGAGQSVPGEAAPHIKDRLSGLYNGWTLWALFAIDAQFATELYPHFVSQFVKRGARSPFPDGRVVVVDGQGTGLSAFALNSGATGYGMIAVATAGDTELLAELVDGWGLLFGAPRWDEAGRAFGYVAPGLPLLFQNGFVLLARTSSPERHLGTIARAGFDAARFDTPHLSAVSVDSVFVNQAVYDAGRKALILTVNGGEATTARCRLSIAGLEPSAAYEVVRDGQLHIDWAWEHELLVINSQALAPTEHTYIVRPSVPVAMSDAGVPTPDAGRQPVDAAGTRVDTTPESAATGGGGCQMGRSGMPANLLWALGLLLLLFLSANQLQ